MTKDQVGSPRAFITRLMLWAYLACAGVPLLFFLVLVFVSPPDPAETPHWIFAVWLLIMAVIAAWALWICQRNFVWAIEGYSWTGLFMVAGLVWHYGHIYPYANPPAILFFHHLGIFGLGLCRGLHSALRYLAAVVCLLIWYSLLYSRTGAILPAILAAVAMALPAWFVDRMESSVRESEERFSKVFQEAAEISLIVDLQTWNIIQTNTAGRKALADVAGELAPLSLEEILPEAKEVLPRLLHPDPAGSPPEIATLKLLRPSGSPCPVDVTAACIPWGRDDAGLLVLRDVSVRKQTEQELENYRLHLEELVRTRTTDLEAANRRLQERTIELEESNAGLNAFSHTVAHDLNSPLSAIQGYAELMLMNQEVSRGENPEKHLEMILANTRRMSRIIQELLLLAGIQRRAEVPLQPLDMAAIWSEVQDRLTDGIRSAGAVIQSPSIWPTAMGYAPWIEEVWVNYLSNALKYGQRLPGEGYLSIEAGWNRLPSGPDSLVADRSANYQPEPDLRFWLYNSGPAIGETDQSRLFGEFVRLDPGSLGGHGLGLSIVRRIVNRLGGEVGLESRSGEGIAFFFTLPEYRS